MLISHQTINLDEIDLDSHRERIRNLSNPTLPIEEELELLEQLSQFEIGRFLLLNRGLDGYWTSYAILCEEKKIDLTALERWLLDHAPTVIATRERFYIFKEQLQQRLKSNIKMASIPCGVMDDLLTLDYSKVENVKLVGIDLDENSIELAKDNAKLHDLDHNIVFSVRDAWQLDIDEEFEIITSNGLNIYEQDNKKVELLYKQFYQALKPGGILITSFLTPPPMLSSDSSWRDFNMENLIKQKALFSDIIQANWLAFRTEKETETQLKNAGFKSIEFIYDSQGIFPTVVAGK